MGAAWIVLWATLQFVPPAQRADDGEAQDDPGLHVEWDDLDASRNRVTPAVLWSLLPGGGQFYLGNVGAGHMPNVTEAGPFESYSSADKALLVFAGTPFLAKQIKVPPMTFRFTW
ncbi:MAG: hypothetical protein HYT87_04560 [Nitrospirae bacterium]|nr:hypothetical protein [Nitrospirota bacterium]